MDDERKDQPEVEQPPPPQPPQGVATAQPEPEPGQPPKTSGMAIAALVCAFLCAPLGLVLGIIALEQINGSRGSQKGSGLAIAAIVISPMLAVTGILAAILFPVFARARDAAQSTNCLNNLRQISVSVQMYTQDWDNVYPMTANWNEAIKPYNKNPRIMFCPSEKSTLPGYAMNARMDRKLGSEVLLPTDTVLMFESVPGMNQAGGPELFPIKARHRDVYSVGFADGHAKSVPEKEVSGLNFNPEMMFAPNPSEPPAPGQ